MNTVTKFLILAIASTLLVLPANLPAQPAGHAHEVAGETCFICDPSKRDKDRLWCRGHHRYEDRCWLCHPELEDKDRLYCSEHHLYEDECFLCHPGLLEKANPKPVDRAENDHDDHSGHGHAGGGLFCNEHGVPEIECAICQPQLAATLAPGENLKIRMPSAESADKAGIQTQAAESREGQPVVEAFCETQYDLNAMARVTPLAEGVIRRVWSDVGAKVRAGDVLAELHSTEVADAKAAFLSATVQEDILRKAFEREKRLRDQNIAAEKDYLEAEAAWRMARLAASNQRQKLLNLGMTEAGIETVSETLDTEATLRVRAPFDGTVVERNAVVGESARTGDALFTVADLSRSWLALSIPSNYAGEVGAGQPVEARFPEFPGIVIRGTIDWVDPAVDPRSRMIRARAVVENSDIRIRKGLYGKATIATGRKRPMSLVPGNAVQMHEGSPFVFVRDEADLYSLRRVRLGASFGDQVEILDGLARNEPVVVNGTFIVMSEFLKSRLGAGCAGH